MPSTDDLLESFKAKYGNSRQPKPIPSDVSFDETASDWIWWWLRYFQDNVDFKTYCEARKAEDTVKCSAMEQQFSRIAELYSDWGDISTLKFGRNGNGWKAWLYEHRHMFDTIVPSVREIISPTPEIESNNIAIQFPVGLSKKETFNLIESFIKTRFPNSKTVGNLKTAKYTLYAPKGRINKSTFNSVTKAFYTQFLSQHNERLGMINRTHAETALEIMSQSFKAKFGFTDTWQLTPDQQLRLQSGKLNMQELVDFKKQISRFNKIYSIYVANTIHGIFPKGDSIIGNID